jgi:tetratricopeptide (TPR) repeat protein
VARLEGNNETAEQLYEQALSLFRELGNPWGANIVLQNLAFIAQRRNDYERARALFGESLTNSQELQDKLTSASCLVGLAGTIAALGQPHIAAQLFGAAEALRETISAQIQPGDRPDYERNLAAVRALLNPQDFDAAWQEGRALSLEQAVALTLEPELLNH